MSFPLSFFFLLLPHRANDQLLSVLIQLRMSETPTELPAKSPFKSYCFAQKIDHDRTADAENGANTDLPGTQHALVRHLDKADPRFCELFGSMRQIVCPHSNPQNRETCAHSVASINIHPFRTSAAVMHEWLNRIATHLGARTSHNDMLRRRSSCTHPATWRIERSADQSLTRSILQTSPALACSVTMSPSTSPNR